MLYFLNVLLLVNYLWIIKNDSCTVAIESVDPLVFEARLNFTTTNCQADSFTKILVSLQYLPKNESIHSSDERLVYLLDHTNSKLLYLTELEPDDNYNVFICLLIIECFSTSATVSFSTLQMGNQFIRSLGVEEPSFFHFLAQDTVATTKVILYISTENSVRTVDAVLANISVTVPGIINGLNRIKVCLIDDKNLWKGCYFEPILSFVTNGTFTPYLYTSVNMLDGFIYVTSGSKIFIQCFSFYFNTTPVVMTDTITQPKVVIDVVSTTSFECSLDGTSSYIVVILEKIEPATQQASVTKVFSGISVSFENLLLFEDLLQVRIKNPPSLMTDFSCNLVKLKVTDVCQFITTSPLDLLFSSTQNFTFTFSFINYYGRVFEYYYSVLSQATFPPPTESITFNFGGVFMALKNKDDDKTATAVIDTYCKLSGSNINYDWILQYPYGCVIKNLITVGQTINACFMFQNIETCILTINFDFGKVKVNPPLEKIVQSKFDELKVTIDLTEILLPSVFESAVISRLKSSVETITVAFKSNSSLKFNPFVNEKIFLCFYNGATDFSCSEHNLIANPFYDKSLPISLRASTETYGSLKLMSYPSGFDNSLYVTMGFSNKVFNFVNETKQIDFIKLILNIKNIMVVTILRNGKVASIPTYGAIINFIESVRPPSFDAIRNFDDSISLAIMYPWSEIVNFYPNLRYKVDVSIEGEVKATIVQIVGLDTPVIPFKFPYEIYKFTISIEGGQRSGIFYSFYNEVKYSAPITTINVADNQIIVTATLSNQLVSISRDKLIPLSGTSLSPLQETFFNNKFFGQLVQFSSYQMATKYGTTFARAFSDTLYHFFDSERMNCFLEKITYILEVYRIALNCRPMKKYGENIITELNVFNGDTLILKQEIQGMFKEFVFRVDSSGQLLKYTICNKLSKSSLCIIGFLAVPSGVPLPPGLCYVTLTYKQSVVNWKRISNMDLKSNEGKYLFTLDSPSEEIEVSLFRHSLFHSDSPSSFPVGYEIATKNEAGRSSKTICTIKTTTFPSLIQQIDTIVTPSSITIYWPRYQIPGLTGYSITLQQLTTNRANLPIWKVDVLPSVQQYTFIGLSSNQEFRISVCSLGLLPTCFEGIAKTAVDVVSYLNANSTIFGVFPVILTPPVSSIFGTVSYCFILAVDTLEPFTQIINPPHEIAYLTHSVITIDKISFYVAASFNEHQCTVQQIMTLGDGIMRGTFDNPPLLARRNYSAFFISCFQDSSCIVFPQYPWYHNVFIPYSSWVARSLFFATCILLFISILFSGLCYNDIILVNFRKSQTSFMNEDISEAAVIRMDIPASEFEKFIMESSANNCYKLTKEYLALFQSTLEKSSNVGLKDENANKNRYQNILPYDETRVVLSKNLNNSNDYINANFIAGVSNTKEYIATQGPLPDTIIDFWRMVVEYKCKGIVMLTKVEEKGKVKCEQYWPTNGIMTIENFKIECLKTMEYEEVRCTNLKVTLSNSDSTENTLILWHLLFHEWMDHSVPIGFEGIRFLHRKCRELVTPSEDPLIIHCSAGVGRTGAFICYDMNLKLLETNQPLGIYKTIKKMRQCRCQMVQTEDQYIYLHMAVLDRILNPESTRPLTQFVAIANNLDSKVVELEYSRLQKLRSTYDKVTLDEEERVFYNNKVYPNSRYCDGYSKKKKYLMVESNNSDFEEFKRVFVYNNVKLVVDIVDKCDDNGLFFNQIPENKVKVISNESFYTMKSFTFSDSQYEIYSIKLSFSSDSKNALNLLYETYYQFYAKIGDEFTNNSKIAFISNDMSSYTSLAIMVDILQEQIKMDGTVGLYESTRRIIAKFPTFLSSKDLYSQLTEFIKKTSIKLNKERKDAKTNNL